MREEIIAAVRDSFVIAVVRGVYGEKCVELARALLEGGISVMECPISPLDPKEEEQALSTIGLLGRRLGGKMYTGAGTVTRPALVEKAFKAGAAFVVAPNTNAEVIRLAREAGMAAIPGALTPTEILHARDCGGDLIKVFPAGSMGMGYWRSLRTPLVDCPLLAFGGVTPSTLPEYRSIGFWGAGVSGGLYKPEWIAHDQWDKVTQAARSYTEGISGETAGREPSSVEIHRQ